MANEDYDYEDYAQYVPQAPQKRYESAIPLLLLVIVILIVGWRLNVFSNIPVISSTIGAGGPSNILIVGQDNRLINTLASIKDELATNYDVIDEQALNEVRDPGYLRNYDLVILTESLSDDATLLPSLFRSYLVTYLNGNGKLMLYGVAASRDPDEPSSDGWKQHDISKYIPVTCSGGQGLCDPDESKEFADPQETVSLKSKDIESPILKEFGTSVRFTTRDFVEFTLVNPRGSGKTLSLLEIERGGRTFSYDAIVEQPGLTGPKTIYFSYHPSLTPTVFKNTLKYMFGL